MARNATVLNLAPFTVAQLRLEDGERVGGLSAFMLSQQAPRDGLIRESRQRHVQNHMAIV